MRQLSIKDSGFVTETTIQALGHDTNEFSKIKPSIQSIHTEKRKVHN